jgi:hypothetical protein
MEKIMSKSNDTLNLSRDKQFRELHDDEMDGVSGGYVYDTTYVMGIVAAHTKATTAFGGNYAMFLPDGTP